MIPLGKRKKWKLSRCTTKVERRWSQLPTLFIWMVKDCLNLSDNARLSSVCKNWNSASRDYKPEPRNHLALPWIIHMDPKTTSCELINFSTMEKIVLHTPELQDNVEVLFSRRGWLLLLASKEQSVLLFNILNNVNVKIEVPKFFQTRWWNMLGSFSLKDDDPHHLALVSFADGVLTLFMVDVGSKKSTEYRYEIGRSGMLYGVSLIVVENHVFILDSSGTTYILDTMTAKWKEIAPSDGCYFQRAETIRMTETQVGEIVQIVECFKPHSFKIYKLDDNKTCWEELHDPNMNWFMSPSGHNNLDLVVKDLSSGRKKAYQLDGDGSYMDMVGNHGSIIKQTIYVHDTGDDIGDNNDDNISDESMIWDDENCWSFVMDDIHFDIVHGDVSTNVEKEEKEEEKNKVKEERMYVEWFHCSSLSTYPTVFNIRTHCSSLSTYPTVFNIRTHWIDLGWIDKVPPSCIGTKLPSCKHSL